MTFNEFWPEYIKRKKITAKITTVSAYTLLWNTHLSRYWGDIDIEQVKNSTAQHYIDEQLSYGRTPKCVKDEVVLIKNMMKQFSIFNDSIFINPIVIWPTASKSLQKKRGKFSEKELSMILDFCRDSTQHWTKLIALSAMTGARIGEVCGLRFSDFNWGDHTIHIQRTVGRIYEKNNTTLYVNEPKTISSNRIVPIPIWICSYFKKYKDLYSKEDEEYIASGDHGLPFIEPRTLRSKFKRLCEKLNIPYKSPHCLRHTYASRLLLKGVDVRTAAELLGHSDVAMTLNVYGHSDNDAKRNAAKKIFL